MGIFTVTFDSNTYGPIQFNAAADRERDYPEYAASKAKELTGRFSANQVKVVYGAQVSLTTLTALEFGALRSTLLDEMKIAIVGLKQEAETALNEAKTISQTQLLTSGELILTAEEGSLHALAKGYRAASTRLESLIDVINHWAYNKELGLR